MTLFLNYNNCSIEGMFLHISFQFFLVRYPEYHAFLNSSIMLSISNELGKMNVNSPLLSEALKNLGKN